ncbi:MAG: hypothetical protein Q9225_006439 [Loekoesia sp. 1 TL-2023]
MLADISRRVLLTQAPIQFASKLAASQPQGGRNALPGQQQGGYPPQLQAGQPSGSYPGQVQYQAYPGGSSAPQGQYPLPQQSGYFSPQQSGQYPPQQQQGSGQYGQHYGAPPPPASRQQIEAYKQLLQMTIQQKSLQNMIQPNNPSLEKYAQRASTQIDQLCARMKVPREVGQDLVKLALFDIVLYIDNSGSMVFEENGQRVEELKNIIRSTVYAATLFDDDGISIRFMNDWPSNPAIDGLDMRRLDRIQNEQMVEHIVSKVQFVGLTPLGTELKNKVIDPLVLGPARARQLQKPVLVITITDGQPAGEHDNVVYEAIRHASNELSRMPQYGPGAISFQFAQVGNDQKAREFLARLDSDPQVGNLIDCTSNFENEQMEMLRTSPSLQLTRELWVRMLRMLSYDTDGLQQVKLLLGSIDSSYDTKDESISRGPGGQSYGAPTPGSYPGSNTYNQQPYPPQQGNFSQPPQQNYGPPPSQQGYGSQSYGHQGYGHSPQPGYGQPPQQSWGQQPPPQGYGHYQQSSYNAPPPPPRY